MYLNSLQTLTGDWTLSIILGTLSTRTLLITPLQVAVRSRIKRYESIKPLIVSCDSSLIQLKQKKTFRKEIYKNYNCSPLKTIGLSLLQLPVFLGMSYSIQNILSNTHSSTFLWINDLSLVDPSYILPITLGGMHLLNLSTYNTLVSSRSSKILGTILSFSMIPISSFVPTGILLYWITSALHALVSNVISNQSQE